MVLVFTTVDTEAAARTLARLLIEQRLAACVQVERIRSTYRWKGSVRQEPEFRLMAKTTAKRVDAVREAWKAVHPYEVPAIWTLTALALEPSYSAWLEAEVQTRDSTDPHPALAWQEPRADPRKR